MIRNSTHVSPDGLLRLVIQAAEGDVTIGFEGFSWHTHADILAGVYGMSQGAAVAHLVQQLLDNKAVIVISRQGEKLLDAWVTDDPERELRHDSEEEQIECRYWDGSAWRPSC